MKWEQYLRLRICGTKWLQTLPALVCVYATVLHIFFDYCRFLAFFEAILALILSQKQRRKV